MGFFDLFRGGPYMAWAKDLPNCNRRLFRRAKYQIVPGPSGIPMAQLDLAFARNAPCIVNPKMSLAVIMDRSGSMSETYSSGHVYNACAAIFNHVNRAGVGFELIFYDDTVRDGGRITSLQQLKQVIKANRPGMGGTIVTPAIRHAVQHLQRGRGLYMIVVTDGEFQDKVAVQDYISRELMPKLTPEDPYHFRLHFVGAGEGADERFLRQLESLASGQGLQLVTSHHHAHLSHSHDDMLDELDRAYLGFGTGVYFGEKHAVELAKSNSREHERENVVTKVGNIALNQWHTTNVERYDFLPSHMTLGFEFNPLHPPFLPVQIAWTEPDESFEFDIPLPKISTAGPNEKRSAWTDFFVGGSPEERAASAEMKARIEQVRQEEEKRQAADLVALARGGIPMQAQARLKEIADAANTPQAFFTSNLAPDEVALLRRHGYKARGLVSGSAMYHVGQAYAGRNDVEIKEITQAYDTATELAVKRMEQELQLIGAHGVIGVRLNVVRHEWTEGTIEVQVMGTAIEGSGPPPKRPWLSDLSGQEWFALHRAGYEPVGLVWGHCAWFVFTTATDELRHRSWDNIEMSHWSDALSNARHYAMKDVTDRMKSVGATGLIGVKIKKRLDEVRLTGPGEDPAYEREHHNLLVSIIGTGIRPTLEPAKPVRQTVNLLSLRDGRIKPMVMMSGQTMTVED